MTGERLSDGPIQSGSLTRLITYLTQLSQDEGYANIRLVIQKGRIEFVHVDRTYRLDSLPLWGEGRTRGESRNPPL